MARPCNHKSARGFSLLEVLVAVVILSVGLLAVASLQMAVIRSSSQTKAQTLAAGLAKERIEELRNFTTLAGYLSKTSAAAPGTSVTLTDSNGSLGGVDYTRTTLITRYVWNKLPAPGAFAVVGNTTTDAALLAAKDGTHDYLTGKDFKRVTVTVSWTDPAGGGTQSIAMEDILDSLDPTEAAQLVSTTTGGTGARTLEQRISDPATDNMVIPIALGGGVDSAATNPKPTVVIGNNTVETRFDVLTYSGVSGGNATAQQKVETTMVGCTCTFTSPPASTVRGWRPTYWNGVRYAAPVQVATSGSESYSPHGKNDPASSGNQSAFCDQCCRDHEDPVGVKGPTFSPRLVTKNSSDVVTVKHDHFNASTVGAPPVTSGTYREACRLIRVDGFWRVAADLQNDYFGLLATGDGTTAPSYAPDTTSVAGSPATVGATARYQNFVLGYMDARFITPTPSSGNEQSTYNNVGTPATLAVSAPYVLNLPANISIDNKFTGIPSCTAITGISKSNPAVVTHSVAYTNCAASSGTAFVNGDKVYLKNVAGMTQINNPGSYYTVANATATTFELQGVNTSGVAYGAYTTGGVAEVSHSKWLHARGVYVDYLEKEATDAITQAKASPTCTVDAAAMKLCILRLLPFTSINLTEIADWDTTDSSKLVVTTNNYSDTATSLEPVRGAVKYAGGANGETPRANAKSRKYNTSLLDLVGDSISPNDDIRTTVQQEFTISAPIVEPVRPGNGRFYVTSSLPWATARGFNYITDSQGSVDCSPGAATPNYTCDVTNAESTAAPFFDVETAGLGVNNTMKVQAFGYNSKGTLANVTTSVTGCTGSQGAKTYVSVTSGAASGRSDPKNYTVNTCTTYTVTAAKNATTNVLASGTPPYTVVGVAGSQAERTTISFPSIAADPNNSVLPNTDQLQITFSSPTTTTKAAGPANGGTCTYVCTDTPAVCATRAATKFTITSAPCP